MVRTAGIEPASARQSAAVLRTAVFAFHHVRKRSEGERENPLPSSFLLGGPRI